MEDKDSAMTLGLAFCLAIAIIGLFLGEASDAETDPRPGRGPQAASWSPETGSVLAFD